MKLKSNHSYFFNYKRHAYPVMNLRGGYNNNALVNIFKLTELMLIMYSRVLVFRIDFHLKNFTDDNKLISDFLSKYIVNLVQIYKCKVTYICAREQSKSKVQHYHLAFFLSGHKVRYPNKIINECKSTWELHSNGTAYFPKNCYYMLIRGDKKTIDPCMYRLSYLVKNYTKDKNGRARSYLMSRIRKDTDTKNDYAFVSPNITKITIN